MEPTLRANLWNRNSTRELLLSTVLRQILTIDRFPQVPAAYLVPDHADGRRRSKNSDLRGSWRDQTCLRRVRGHFIFIRGHCKEFSTSSSRVSGKMPPRPLRSSPPQAGGDRTQVMGNLTGAFSPHPCPPSPSSSSCRHYPRETWASMACSLSFRGGSRISTPSSPAFSGRRKRFLSTPPALFGNLPRCTLRTISAGTTNLRWANSRGSSIISVPSANGSLSYTLMAAKTNTRRTRTSDDSKDAPRESAPRRRR